MEFKYIELFAGIGGFRQALDRLGGKCVFASEIDKFAAQAYEALYGEKPAGDITKIDAKDIPDHDLLTAGFPCQAFSVAGKRLGFEDTRGTLFFEIVRIAKEKRPKVLLLENVKGLVGHNKGKTIETIILVLNDIGYTVDFQVLNSKYFGVPQNRERVFFVCIRDDLVEREPWVIEGNNVVAKTKKRLSQINGVKTFNFDWPEQTEVTTRLRDILEDNVDERYYLSEEKTAKLVAQLEKTTGKTFEDLVDVKVIQQAESGIRLRDDSGTLRQCLNQQHLVEKGIDDCESVLKQYERFVKREGFIPELFNPYSNTEITDVAPTQTAQCSRVNNSSTVLKIEPQMLRHVDIRGHDAIERGEQKIAEPQINKIGHLPSDSGQTGAVYGPDGIAPTCLNQHGNAVTKIAEYTVIQRTHSASTTVKHDGKRIFREEIRPVLTPDREEKRQNGRRFKEDGEEAFTLTAQDKHGVAIGKYPRYRIRKLTPLECWRLQGFPDEAHERVKRAGISDSQRYKQAGNAVTVNVVEAIGRRLIPMFKRKGGDQHDYQSSHLEGVN